MRLGRGGKEESEEVSAIHNTTSRLLQVLQGSYMMAFGLLAVAAVSDVVGGYIE